MGRPKEARSSPERHPVPADVIDRCKRGDEVAWNQLVEATHRDVYTLCLRILRDSDDAAEATQDTYLKVWRNLSGFRGDAAFETWLYRVATNAALSKHRSRKRRRTHETGVEDETLGRFAATGSVEATAGARLDVRELERALGDLPEHYREAVVLRDVYGLSIEEVAKQMKISETAAKVRIHRGRKKVKEVMYPRGENR